MKLDEKQLISKLRELRQVKPQKEWVFFTKNRILGEPTTRSQFILFPYFKPAYVMAGLFIVCVMLTGSFVLVKNSLPGDLLYAVRQVAHKGEALLVPEGQKTVFQLKLANDRLEDLTKASARNLAPTINEFQANISEAVKELVKIDATTSSPIAMKQILAETKKIEENKKIVESLGMILGGTEELDNALMKVTGDLIEDLEIRTLTEAKEELLNQMKVFFEEGKYSDALELYLTNQ